MSRSYFEKKTKNMKAEKKKTIRHAEKGVQWMQTQALQTLNHSFFEYTLKIQANWKIH